VGAPDEAGHRGDLSAKIKAIEEIDEKVIGVLLERLHGFTDYKLMVLPDHATPLCHRTHTADPVPFLILRKTKKYPSGLESFSEKNAALTGLRIEEGFRLMDYFIG
jgi:2,3-bisphosphoglycerate-independent phosphoglycerate mutase